ncbi:MAG: trypsin-like serine protease [Pseudomonadota bacterium]
MRGFLLVVFGFGLAPIAAYADPPAHCQFTVNDDMASDATADATTTEGGNATSDAIDAATSVFESWIERLGRLSGTSKKIVGGDRACPGDWPYNVALRRPESADIGYYCGGTVISDRWVLTAAHCVRESRRSSRGFWAEPTGKIEVVVGAYDLANEPVEQIYEVTDIKVHPQYKPYNLQTQEAELNDLALIKLNRPWQGPVATLSASAQSDADQALGRAFVSGFGVQEDPTAAGATGRQRFNRTMDGQSVLAGSRYLLQTVVPMVSSQTCRDQWGAFNPNTKICAGYKVGGKDSCQGDSGGPLVALDRNNQPYQIGVVSYGWGCAKEDSYGVYTRVSAFEDWIRQYVTDARFVDAAPETNHQMMLSMHDQFMNNMSAAADRVDLKLKTGPDFVEGELLEFDVESSIAGRLVVLDIGASGKVTQIFPNAYSSGDSLVDAGETVSIPSREHGDFVLPASADPAGEGRLMAFVIPADVDMPEGFRTPKSEGLAERADSNGFALNLLNLLEDRAIEEGESVVVKPGWGFSSTAYSIRP